MTSGLQTNKGGPTIDPQVDQHQGSSGSRSGRFKFSLGHSPAMAEKQRMLLNSRRVTRSQLWAVAEKLGLPTSATGEDLAQIVSGKLTEEGRDPKNVQIVLSDDQLQLEDMDGVFLTVTLEEEAEEH